METYLCPKGHASTEADYCSECGAKIQGAAAPALPEESVMDAQACPECSAPREANDITFCEICGFNFITGARGEIPVAAARELVPTAAQELQVNAAEEVRSANVLDSSRAAPQSWEVTVIVDATLREAGSPEAPAGVGPFVFTLTEAVSLIGRRSETRGIYPEIPLTHDDAVSHRHALLQLAPGSALLLRDIGASNGTRVNGPELRPMVDHPLHDGDQITLGHWSRIAVKAVL